MDTLSFSFSLSCTRTHTIAHTALTSCFYPREVIQGSGVQMKTNNSGRPYCSSSLWLFLRCFLVAVMIKHFLPFALPSTPLRLNPSSFLPHFALTLLPQPPSALDFTRLFLNINSYSLRSFAVRCIALAVRRSHSVFILISIQRASILYSF